MRTQVAIVGAGPAGLLLGRLLHQSGIDSVILELKGREYIENRVRAGVLEHQSVDILKEAGVGARMAREGLMHHGIVLRFNGRTHRIDLEELTGHGVTVYGQQEVVKELVEARIDTGEPILFDVGDVSIHGFDTDAPEVRFRAAAVSKTLRCDFIAGCDGFHGICRPSIPAAVVASLETPSDTSAMTRKRSRSPAWRFSYAERSLTLRSVSASREAPAVPERVVASLRCEHMYGR